MKKIFKNYKSTIILLSSIIIGVIIGLVFKEKATILSPLGDIFMNLLFVSIVPLIFLTITSSIIKMDSSKRLANIMSHILIVFIITSIISAFIGIIATSYRFVDVEDSSQIIELFNKEEEINTELSLLERTASLLTVNDFNLLLSKNAIIPLLIFAIIFGLAIRKTKDKKIINLILSLNDVVLKMIDIIMLYAPIGLCAYIASLIGTFGSAMVVGFLKTFIMYTTTSLLVYFVLYSVYALIAGGKKGLITYWKNILPPTLTALATCSSAASIPVNIKSTKNMGIKDDIVDATIPLGTTFHKDGSVIGSVFKIMFLVYLFGVNPSIWQVIGVSLIATLLLTAIPVGGGTISEMFIISLMSFPAASLPILTIIATIIDAPATVLNVTGDSASALLISRFTDGKENTLKDEK